VHIYVVLNLWQLSPCFLYELYVFFDLWLYYLKTGPRATHDTSNLHVNVVFSVDFRFGLAAGTGQTDRHTG